jgi:methylaspartate mutase epsilon subunit
MDIKIRNKRLSDDEFFKIRNEEVLTQWETGKEIANLHENIAMAKELSEGKNYARKLMDAKKRGIHLLQPQFGRALTEYMMDGMQYVESQACLAPNGVWNCYTDSYTRKGDFKRAAAGLERSKKEGMNMINGFPIVNHGVEEARKIKRAIQSPITFNSTDEDGRLASEIALAAGFNSCNVRSLQEVIAHCKHIPLAEEIRINQYEARLAAIYHENGVPQCPHNPCNLTGYDSPGYHSLVTVSESLLAAEQGVKCMLLEHGLGMSLIQDIAMIRVSEKLCKEYCERFGYQDMTFVTGGFPFLGAWPARVEEANAMVAWNATIVMMGGFTNVILKCQDEAFATPTKEGMAAAVRIARHLDTLMGTQVLADGDSEKLRIEEAMLEMEVRAVMEKCLEAGDGDMAVGLCQGVEAGWIDTMLTPWKYNKGNVLVMRDAENAVRYWKTGDVPIPKEVKEYNLEKLKSREAKEGRPLDLDMLIKDLQFASTIAK